MSVSVRSLAKAASMTPEWLWLAGPRQTEPQGHGLLAVTSPTSSDAASNTPNGSPVKERRNATPNQIVNPPPTRHAPVRSASTPAAPAPGRASAGPMRWRTSSRWRDSARAVRRALPRQVRARGSWWPWQVPGSACPRGAVVTRACRSTTTMTHSPAPRSQRAPPPARSDHGGAPTPSARRARRGPWV